MATAKDVAAYILQTKGPVTAMKLQKLVYYCQAWHLVWEDEPLFPEKIEAWVNGPVVRELWDAHRGCFRIESIPGGDPENLTDAERTTIDAVLEFYGDKSSQWLSDLTHMEEPWRRARGELAPDDRTAREIPLASMADYYSALQPQ